MKAAWERWSDAVSALPADQRPADAPETAQLLGRLFQFAPAQGDFLIAHPETLAPLLSGGLLERDLSLTEFRKSRVEFCNQAAGPPMNRIRLWKQRQFFRIALRDLLGKAPVEQTMAELSALAEVSVQGMLDRLSAELSEKLPPPSSAFAVLGLGKLGGQELNYSSDIDLIYIYSEEGQTGRLSNHEWFGRLAQALTQELAKRDTHGAMYRVDLRLRPEGNTGPIVHSLESCENYYAAFGETWERLALAKARGIAGDRELAYELCQRLQPFIYPRSIPRTIVDEVYQLKKRIEEEIVGKGALDRHVKLGRGGIREIEFIAQTLQLLHGARNPFLQERGTLKSLHALHRLELLDSAALKSLVAAYRCFRMVEHRLQMRYDLQTHTLPPDWEKKSDLWESLDYESAELFAADIKTHQENVRRVFDSLLEDGGGARAAESASLDWPEKPSEQFLEELKALGLKDAGEAYQALRALAQGPAFVHTAPRTKKLFARLWPFIREQLPKEARPDLCLKQLERFTEAYGTRSALFEILLRRPKLLEILFLIFDNSRYLTDTIIRHPEFIEDIALTGTLDYQKTPEDVRLEIETEVRSGIPLEKVLRLTKRSELLRIELRAMMGKAGLDVTMQEWSELADVSLQMAAENVGVGEGFGVIAMGKFGGKELSNGSDLDILFIGDDLKKAVRIIRLMTETTEDGIVFPIDARLRPYGNEGVLTVPIETYREYYKNKAQLWERLALTRARHVAGDPALGAQFREIVDSTLYRASLGRDELNEIFAMRKRIEEERATKTTRFNADYKTGKGGLVDIEFMVQISQLLHGPQDPAWRATNTIELLKLTGWSKLVENYLFLRKMEFSLRRFHLTEESSIPRDPEQQWILARHMGFKTFDEFLKVYEPVLKENRAEFDQFRASVIQAV